MSGTECPIPVDGEREQPEPFPIWWSCLWIAWGTLGAAALVALDRDAIAPLIWLLSGAVIGIVGPKVARLVQHHFFNTFMRLWENPHEFRIDRRTLKPTYHDDHLKGEAARGGLIVAPIFGLFYGFLLGPFLGVLASWQSEGPRWIGALEGLVMWWAVISTVAAIVSAVMCPRVLHCGPKCSPPRWMYLASPLFGVLAIVNCLAALYRLPGQRRILRDFTRRGAAFSWDGISNFHGISFREREFSDDDLKELRWFPDLDHLNLAGTRVTDAGLPYVARLKCLQILDLSGTGITDEAVPHLLQLTKLWLLELHATAATDAAVSRLRCGLPRCRISH